MRRPPSKRVLVQETFRPLRTPCLCGEWKFGFLTSEAQILPGKKTMPTYILGVSAFYHDSAACLVRDGHIVAAAQEERFTRKKFDARFPTNAIRYCLQE